MYMDAVVPAANRDIVTVHLGLGIFADLYFKDALTVIDERYYHF